jgi:hypothetical protein
MKFTEKQNKKCSRMVERIRTNRQRKYLQLFSVKQKINTTRLYGITTSHKIFVLFSMEQEKQCYKHGKRMAVLIAKTLAHLKNNYTFVIEAGDRIFLTR